MKIDLNDDVMIKVDLNERQIKELLAVSLYQINKINGVQGGKILGVSEIEFHEIAGKLGQTFSYDENDLLNDIETLKKF